MLMAQPGPGSELRTSSLPGQIQLPSFSHFLSGVGQSDSPLSQNNRSPTSRSDPSDERKVPAIHPREDYPRPRPLYQASVQGGATHSHYVDVLPKVHLQPPRSAESYQDQGDSHSTASSPAWPAPNRFSPNLSHLPAITPEQAAASNKKVLRETNIEGKGPCYVYDDGTVCQKVINGDMVNPKWGTTKAGKPRKRLGQACNTCREKKIRCDPQLPKCAQCQKFGRECKFESSSRSSKHSSNRDSTSSRENPSELYHERTGSSTSTEAPTDRSYSRANSRGSMNVESLLSPSSTVDASPSSDQPPAKKPRFSSSPKHYGNQQSKTTAGDAAKVREDGSKTKSDHQFAFDMDPYQVDPRIALHYIKEYFKHINSHIYVLYQPKSFLTWVERCQRKTTGDMMVLYAMLAAGAVFSSAKSDDSYQYQFKNIAEIALSRNNGSNLQAVQTQLILSMVEHSLGNVDCARDLSISAIGMAYKAGLSEEPQSEKPIFDMSLASHFECRRRTFWLAFTALSFHGNRFGLRKPVETLTCDLRLPCEDELFESGDIPELPYFQCDGSHNWEFPHSPSFGNLAFLVNIALITNELTAWLNTSMDLPHAEYASAYESMYHSAKRKLRLWDQRIRAHYGKPATTGLHILYHFVGMLLHRHVRHELVSYQQVDRSCRETRSHAIQLLEMVHHVHENGGKDVPVSVVAAGCPMVGDTIMMAVGIVTAAGTIQSLLDYQSRELSFIELSASGLEALDTLGKHWKTAEEQLKVVKQRVSTVTHPATSGTSGKHVGFFVRTPLMSPYGMECDVVYGIPRLRYLQALGYGDKVKSEEDIYELLGSQSPS